MTPPTACPQKSGDARTQQKPTGHGTKSDAVREKAIVALLSARSVGAAARQCGINEKTLRRWMADDEAFKATLAEARRVNFETGMSRLQALAGEAVDAFAALLRPGTPPTVRLGAARAVLEMGLYQRDADTIMRRLADLESRQQEAEGRPSCARR